LIEGFLLSCKVENKSPATISFYQHILDKFQWYLGKFDIETIDATAIRGFLLAISSAHSSTGSIFLFSSDLDFTFFLCLVPNCPPLWS